MNLLDKAKSFFKKSLVASGGGYPLYLSGGYIPTDWSWNWWQEGKDPLGQGAGTATVYACSAAYAQTIAACSAGHWRKNSDGGRTQITTSPLARFLHRPNSYQTRSDFVLNMVQQLMLYGNTYAYAVRDNSGNIESAHLLKSGLTQVHIEPESRELFYGVSSNLNQLVPNDLEMLIPARDVLHIRLYTPDHPLMGVSPVRYAAAAVAANSAISSHQAIFFNNMSRPSGVITTDQILNKEQLTILREAWNAQSQNLNSGQVPILHAGMKFESMSINSQDAQLVQAFAMTVEDIARAFRVPLPLIGDNRHSTYNNVEQLISSWLSTGLGFTLEHIEQSIANWFGLKPLEYMNFDTDTLLRTEFAGRVDALTKGIMGGLYSPNEARMKEGLPSVEFGDEPRLQAQAVPLSAAGNMPEPAPAAPVEPVVEPDKDVEPDGDEKIIALHEIRLKMEERKSA